jgi:hypothetical protein
MSQKKGRLRMLTIEFTCNVQLETRTFWLVKYCNEYEDKYRMKASKQTIDITALNQAPASLRI